MTQPDTEYVDRVVTCHTEGCVNVDVAIILTVPDDVGGIVCGPCGQTIVDVTAE
jgi:hypothetical protein